MEAKERQPLMTVSSEEQIKKFKELLKVIPESIRKRIRLIEEPHTIIIWLDDIYEQSFNFPIMLGVKSIKHDIENNVILTFYKVDSVSFVIKAKIRGDVAITKSVTYDILV